MSIHERPPSIPSAGDSGSQSGNRGADGNNPAASPDARTSPHFQNMWMRFNEAQKAQRNETTLDPADNPTRPPEGEVSQTSQVEKRAETPPEPEGAEQEPRLVWNTPREPKPATDEKRQEIEARRAWVDNRSEEHT